MPTFKNLKEMELYIQYAIEEVIEKELFPVVRDTWLEFQHDNVYEVYNPIKYKRRGTNEGLADPDNIVMLDPKKSKELTEFVMVNIATGATEDFEDVLINKLIEGEDGFAGNPLTGMPARPYTEEAVDFLAKGIGRNIVKQALHDGLMKRGINIKFY